MLNPPEVSIPDDAIVLSPSRIKSWQYCSQAHYYKYVLRIERKQRKAIALQRGSTIHEMIEAHHHGEDWTEVLEETQEWYNELLAEEQEYYGNFPDEMERIMTGYLNHWKRDDLRFVEVEGELGPYEIKKGSGIYLKGKVDRIAIDPQGREWVKDTKTGKSFPDERTRAMNIQALIYVWLARKAGYNPVGIIWDYVRTKPPAIPKLLKRGGLSKAKKIDTTPEVYLAEINKLGLNPDKYRDILKILEGKSDDFYTRVRQPISKTAMKAVIQLAYTQGQRIRKYQHKPIQELNWQCGRCDFYSPCHAKLHGLDEEFILRNEYEVRKNGGEEEEEAESTED